MMVKGLFLVIIAVLVLTENVQSTLVKSRFIDPKGAAAHRALNLASITNALSNGNFQNTVNSILSNLKIEVPQVPQKALALPTNISEADIQFIADLVAVNVKFFLDRTDLDDSTKGVLASVVPEIIKAKTQEELMAVLEPLILTGLGIFFQDPYIIFNKHPYLEATNRILKMFFASPDAPEFLKDIVMQEMVLAYVEKLFATNDPTLALSLASMDLFMYFNVASGQEIKPLIQMYLPELYTLIENETDLVVIYNVVLSYAVTELVNVYNMIMNLFTGGSSSMDGTVEVMRAALRFGQRLMVQNRK